MTSLVINHQLRIHPNPIRHRSMMWIHPTPVDDVDPASVGTCCMCDMMKLVKKASSAPTPYKTQLLSYLYALYSPNSVIHQLRLLLWILPCNLTYYNWRPCFPNWFSSALRNDGTQSSLRRSCLSRFRSIRKIFAEKLSKWLFWGKIFTERVTTALFWWSSLVPAQLRKSCRRDSSTSSREKVVE